MPEYQRSKKQKIDHVQLTYLLCLPADIGGMLLCYYSTSELLTAADSLVNMRYMLLIKTIRRLKELAKCAKWDTVLSNAWIADHLIGALFRWINGIPGLTLDQRVTADSIAHCLDIPGSHVWLKQRVQQTRLLHEAIIGSGSDVEQLLDAQVSTESRGGLTYTTPLMHAASSGNSALVALLIRRGASVNAQALYGDTALAESTSSGVSKLLLQSGACIALACKTTGYTALHKAITNGELVFQEREALVTLLLNFSAPIDTADAHGQTALAHALARGYTHIVKLLLDAGADYRLAGKLMRDNEGDYYSFLIDARSQRDIKKLLYKALRRHNNGTK